MPRVVELIGLAQFSSFVVEPLKLQRVQPFPDWFEIQDEPFHWALADRCVWIVRDNYLLRWTAVNRNLALLWVNEPSQDDTILLVRPHLRLQLRKGIGSRF